MPDGWDGVELGITFWISPQGDPGDSAPIALTCAFQAGGSMLDARSHEVPPAFLTIRWEPQIGKLFGGGGVSTFTREWGSLTGSHKPIPLPI